MKLKSSTSTQCGSYHVPTKIFIVSLLITGCEADCVNLVGPVGDSICAHLPGYTRHQWMTCVFNVIIPNSVAQCGPWYNGPRCDCSYCACMLERYAKANGSVYPDCACDPELTPPSYPSIPPWCFNPTGENCIWYRQCLEVRHPCEGTPAAYAITYAEKFCELYSEAMSGFSEIGKRWVNAVRKCLQLKLVPLLRPWLTPSCDVIKDTAFKSHTPCYVQAFPGEPSICDLPTQDIWRVFWTIKSGFLSAFSDSMEGLLQTMMGCVNFYTDKLQQGGRQIIFELGGEMKSVVVWVKRSLSFRKRSAVNEHTLAGEVSDSIASQLQWQDQGLVWFSYINETKMTDTSSPEVPVSIILADREAYTSTNITGAADMDTAVENLATTVSDGSLDIRVPGPERVTISRLEACSDFHCVRSYLNATAPPVTSGSCRVFVRHVVLTAVIYVILQIL